MPADYVLPGHRGGCHSAGVRVRLDAFRSMSRAVSIRHQYSRIVIAMYDSAHSHHRMTQWGAPHPQRPHFDHSLIVLPQSRATPWRHGVAGCLAGGGCGLDGIIGQGLCSLPYRRVARVRSSSRSRNRNALRCTPFHDISPAQDRRSETTMSNELVETGWKRFLDRLRQLWGKSSGAGAPAAAATTAIAETRAPLVPEEPSAPSPGSP